MSEFQISESFALMHVLFFGGRTDLAASRAALSRRLSPTFESSSAVDPPLDYLLNQGAASAASRRRL